MKLNVYITYVPTGVITLAHIRREQLNYTTADMESQGWLKIGEVEFELPKFDDEELMSKMREAQQGMLNNNIAKMRATIKEQEDRIQTLLGITPN